MASLSGNASTGETNWEKYVKNNARFKTTSYVLESDTSLLVFSGSKSTEKALKKSTSIKILSPQIKIISDKQYANIRTAGKTGFVLISKIKKPTGSSTASKKAGIDFGLLVKYQKNGMASSYTLNTPSPTESGERDFINEINSKITTPITLKIGTKTYNNVVGVNKVAGTPKADLVFVSYNESSKSFAEVCYVSHKKGSTYRDFGQWSGISPSAGSSIFDHPLTQKFIADVQKHADKTFNNKAISATFTIVKKIEGKNSLDLMMRSMYGPDYGSPGRGANNIDFLLQGTPSLTKLGKSYQLSMSGSIHANGEMLTSGFVPAFMAYRKGSKGDRSQFGVPGGRFVISPIGGRKADFVIDENGKLRKGIIEIKDKEKES
jgi:hypothetical protein